jgi:LCP family protein required for cell wall assembly
MSESPGGRPRNRTSSRLFLVLLVAFLIAASLTAVFAYRTVRDAVTSLGSSPDEPVFVEGQSTPIPQEIRLPDLAAPLQPENGPAPREWDGESRVTVLLLGLDGRDWIQNYGPPLADTIILATLDPQSRTAGMLSIPRDLWVRIPGYGYHKINQSFQLGEADHAEGGGAGLAIETVENFLDVKINYYIQIDFNAFVRIIDEIGGVKINVPETIVVDPVGRETINKTLTPGIQTLPGEIALAYARARNTPGSDFDRAARQQQVIMAIRERVISFQMLPTLISKAAVIYQEISRGVNTNLNLQQIIQLAWLAQQLPPENIRQGVIGPDLVINSISADGMAILQPIPDQIMLLRDEIFSSEIEPAALNPTSIAGMTPNELMLAEEARVGVLNGTFTPGLAAKTYEFLIDKQVNMTEADNADQLYPETTLIDYTGKPYTIEYLMALMDIPPGNIYHRYDPESTVDVVVILGEDWAEDNPMP